MQDHKTKLKIISINVNSLVSIVKRSYLLSFLKLHNPDVLLLNETKLNKKHNIIFENYNFIRTDRKHSTRGGGTAILISNKIKYSNVIDPTLNNNDCIETTIVSIPLHTGNQLYIVACYAPISSQLTFETEINLIFNTLKLNELQNYYIIAGDLNGKHSNWLNTENNPRGELLNKWINDNHILYKCTMHTPCIPTYPRTNSYLDICLADSRLDFHQNNNNNWSYIVPQLDVLSYDSDHNAILLNLSITSDLQFVLDTKEKHLTYNFKATNWKKFEKNMVATISNNTIPNNVNLSNDEIDNYIEQIHKQIEDAIQKTVPKYNIKNNMSLFENSTIKNLKKQKSKLLSSIFQLYRTNQGRKNPQINLLKSILGNINTLLKQNFNKSINEYWKKNVQSISTKDNRNMFRKINSFFRKKTKINTPDLIVSYNDSIMDSLNLDAQIPNTVNNIIYVTKDEDKLNLLGRNFELVHSQNNGLSSHTFTKPIEDNIVNFIDSMNNTRITSFSCNKLANSLSIEQTQEYFTTFENLKRIFSTLNNKTSYGVDNIPNIILKHIPDLLISQYCTLFNNSLNNKYFPSSWKFAKVLPILKKGKDPTKYDSYRPISLLPNIGKVYEVIINQLLQTFCDNNNIIPDCQFGFRRGHSTIHAIGKFTSDCCWYLNQSKMCVGVCLVDLQCAFDTIWNTGLIFKMLKCKFPIHIIHLIHNMINNKKFVVTNGQQNSSKVFNVISGLQQGTVNAPILFNIFISELLQSYQLNKSPNKHILAYADDLIIYTGGKTIGVIQNNIQNMFNNINDYLINWKLNINPKKCETILLRPPLKFLNNNLKKNWKKFIIKAGSEKIPNNDVVRYLGIYIDKYMYYTSHLTTQLKKANTAFSILKRLFYNKNLNSNVKILCYKSLIRPILTYGCAIWYNISSSYMEKYRILERKILRVCLSKYRSSSSQYKHYISNQKIYKLADIVRIDIFILSLIRKHINRSSEMITDNDYIWQPYYRNNLYFEKAIKNGFIPPEAFIYLDEHGYIQNDAAIPIIYHTNRRPTNKSLKHTKFNVTDEVLKFSSTLTKKDLEESEKKYWWNSK